MISIPLQQMLYLSFGIISKHEDEPTKDSILPHPHKVSPSLYIASLIGFETRGWRDEQQGPSIARGNME
jgi:hypothetical protein